MSERKTNHALLKTKNQMLPDPSKEAKPKKEKLAKQEPEKGTASAKAVVRYRSDRKQTERKKTRE